jgi:hypothetical protein
MSRHFKYLLCWEFPNTHTHTHTHIHTEFCIRDLRTFIYSFRSMENLLQKQVFYFYLHFFLISKHHFPSNFLILLIMSPKKILFLRKTSACWRYTYNSVLIPVFSTYLGPFLLHVKNLLSVTPDVRNRFPLASMKPTLLCVLLNIHHHILSGYEK